MAFLEQILLQMRQRDDSALESRNSSHIPTSSAAFGVWASVRAWGSLRVITLVNQACRL